MLICRYLDAGRPRHGRVDQAAGLVVPVGYDPAAGRWTERAGPARPLRELALLPPADPGKIVCLALNYAPGGRAAAAAQRAGGGAGAPVLLKPPSSLAAHGVPVFHPGADWELKHEAELAVVISTACKRVTPERAGDVVAGYTCANDLTAYARRLPEDPVTGYPPVWAKHFDRTTPLGPWLVTDLDPADVEITCRVDGELRQQGSTRDLIWSVHETVALVSEHMTLLPGDVILTGTPAGSGPLSVGSRVEVSITGIGTLHNVIDMPSAAPWTPDTAGVGAGAHDEPAPAGLAATEKGLTGR